MYRRKTYLVVGLVGAAVLVLIISSVTTLGLVIHEVLAKVSKEALAENQIADDDKRAQRAAAVVNAKGAKNPVDDQRADTLGLYLLKLGEQKARLVASEVDDERAYIGSPAWSPDGNRVFFDASPGKNFRKARLHALTLNEERAELADLGIGNCPAPSPDGKHIAFLLNTKVIPDDVTGVHVMNVDGTQRWRLGGFGIPKWSPDGRQVLVVGFANPPPLTLIDLETSEMRTVTLPDHRILSVPSWARPGQIVAVVNSKTATALALVDITTPGQAVVREVLWRVADGPRVEPLYPVYCTRTKTCYFVGRDKDGQALYQLGADKRPERLEPDRRANKIASLALSPDGRQLLFCSDR